jgi:hypothetical protein
MALGDGLARFAPFRFLRLDGRLEGLDAATVTRDISEKNKAKKQLLKS